MPVYVDHVRLRYKVQRNGKEVLDAWSQLTADSLPELSLIAMELGLCPETDISNPDCLSRHILVNDAQRAFALQLGAIEVESTARHAEKILGKQNCS